MTYMYLDLLKDIQNGWVQVFETVFEWIKKKMNKQ